MPPTAFNARELGALVGRLQRACTLCSRHGTGCAVGGDASHCPVERARAVVGRYLFSGVQAEPGASPDTLPQRPPDAILDRLLLEEVLAHVPTLCRRCLFHSPRCFMNVLYRSVELALDRTPKPLDVRPGDLL